MEVSRCLVTYSHNQETHQHGPTLQIVAVHKSKRNKNLATKMIDFLNFHFLGFWKPKHRSLVICASNIVSAHDFFRSFGFQFFDQFQEEASLLVHREEEDIETETDKAEQVPNPPKQTQTPKLKQSKIPDLISL
mmetsp:Transcript_15458/g.19682  ORF Transcript_15458/g.19682 Transcript_15458/m.19682 type:complete len:134 (-) Transcript_15458:41-442(-)